MSSFHSRSSVGSSGGKIMTEELRSRLKTLTDAACADCDTRKPGWASLIRTPVQAPNNVSTLVAFICYQCASHHRSLGTHVCRVKSCTLDEWNDKEMWAAEIGGNERVNAIFEAKLDAKARAKRPQEHSSNTERAAFLKAKYVEKKYLDVSKYALCRGKRIPESEDKLSSHLRSGSFKSPTPPPFPRSSSFTSHQSNTNTPVTPKVVKPSLFFTPDTPTEHDEIDNDDMFADSATTTSELFGRSSTPNRNKMMLKSMSSFDGPIMEGENDEDDDPNVDSVAGFDDPFAEDDENEDDEESEIAYPKLAMSVSDISAFQSLDSTIMNSAALRSANSSVCDTTRTIKRAPSPLSKRTASLPPMYSPPSVEALEKQKQQAIKREDYLKAAQIKKQIATMLNPPNQAEINGLESLKKLAVRQEDYVRAAELKAKIEELRGQGRSNRQLLVESSVNSVMALAKRADSPACHRRSLDTFFERNEEDDLERAVQQGLKQAHAAPDLEEQSIQLSQLGRPNDASERFCRSIADASECSKLDTNGFVVDDAPPKPEETDKAPVQPKSSEPLSRRNSRVSTRESFDETDAGKRRSRSQTRKGTRRSSTGKNNDEPNQRRRSKSRDKKSERRDRSKSRDKKSDRRDRSKSKDRKSAKDKSRSKKDLETNDRQRRARSKSRDRKSFQKEKERRNRSKSRDKKSSDKGGRTSRDARPSTASKTRSRSKSQSRNQARRKKSMFLHASADALGTSQQVPLPPRSPQKRLQSMRPEYERQTSSSIRRRSNDSGDIDNAIHRAHHSADDISFNDSLTSEISEKIQSAHHRDSKGRVAKSRRNLKVKDDESDAPNPPNRKGSRSLHVSHSFFDFDGAKDKNFFIASAPVSTPPAVSRRTKNDSELKTPAPSLERKLSLDSPAGVDEFPLVPAPDTPKAPPDESLGGASPASARSARSNRSSISAKYQREVDRTANRLERLRRKRRASNEATKAAALQVVSH